jgi:hypothetical protein
LGCARYRIDEGAGSPRAADRGPYSRKDRIAGAATTVAGGLCHRRGRIALSGERRRHCAAGRAARATEVACSPSASAIAGRRRAGCRGGNGICCSGGGDRRNSGRANNGATDSTVAKPGGESTCIGAPTVATCCIGCGGSLPADTRACGRRGSTAAGTAIAAAAAGAAAAAERGRGSRRWAAAGAGCRGCRVRLGAGSAAGAIARAALAGSGGCD